MKKESGRTKTRRVWRGMIYRCTKPTHASYKDYGGRGIKVCERWLDSFEEFLRDMGIRPEGYSIERIDVNGNYCPENCKWIPRNDQPKNLRKSCSRIVGGKHLSGRDQAKLLGIGKTTFCNWYRNGKVGDPPKPKKLIKILHNGVEMTLMAAAEIEGVNYATAFARYKNGKPQSEWFKKRVYPTVHHNGVEMTLTEASRATGIKMVTIRGRMYMGWPKDRWLDPENHNKLRSRR